MIDHRLGAACVVAILIAATACTSEAPARTATATYAPTAVTSATEPAAPPPTPASRPTATAPATPRPPSYAPGGRTGIEDLDSLIASLLSADAPTLVARFPAVVAHRGPDRRDIPVEEWAADLAAAGPRSLYAVVDDSRSGIVPYRTYDVVVSTGSGAERRGWRFAVDRGTVVEVYESPDQYVNALVPDPPGAYDQFLVLPPRDELPKPPTFHSLATRTRNADVDAILGASDPHAVLGAGNSPEYLLPPE